MSTRAAILPQVSRAWAYFVLTKPDVTFFVVITSLIGSFKVFNEIFVLYGGGPGPVRAGLTMVFYIYEKAWTDYRAGLASAAAYLLFLMVLGVTLVQLLYSKRRVYYD